jgi:hypothetical protein
MSFNQYEKSFLQLFFCTSRIWFLLESFRIRIREVLKQKVGGLKTRWAKPNFVSVASFASRRARPRHNTSFPAPGLCKVSIAVMRRLSKGKSQRIRFKKCSFLLVFRDLGCLAERLCCRGSPVQKKEQRI